MRLQQLYLLFVYPVFHVREQHADDTRLQLWKFWTGNGVYAVREQHVDDMRLQPNWNSPYGVMCP